MIFPTTEKCRLRRAFAKTKNEQPARLLAANNKKVNVDVHQKTKKQLKHNWHNETRFDKQKQNKHWRSLKHVNYFSMAFLPAAHHGHGTSPVSYWKILEIFVLENFFRCLHSVLRDSCGLLRRLYFGRHWDHLLVFAPKIFTNWTMWMGAITWFNTNCLKPSGTGCQAKTVGLQIS